MKNTPKKTGRKPLPADKRRVRLNTIVSPETLAKIRELSESGNLSLGQVVDQWAGVR
jgi:hypothetical protein